jgi:hypothetical protein
MQDKVFFIDEVQTLYDKVQNNEISFGRFVEILNGMCMNWQKDLPTNKPEYDGNYLCHIVRNNECGTFSKYQRVVELKFNVWRLTDEKERITHWCITPPPDRTVMLLS